MPTVFIPPRLQSLTGGTETVEVEALDVRGMIEELDAKFPGVRDRLIEDDDIKPGITVAVDGNVSPIGLLQRAKPESEVHFLPAIGGG